LGAVWIAALTKGCGQIFTFEIVSIQKIKKINNIIIKNRKIKI